MTAKTCSNLKKDFESLKKAYKRMQQSDDVNEYNKFIRLCERTLK